MKVLLVALMLLNIAYAQRVYFSKYDTDSQADVIFVGCKCRANTLVHITSREMAKRSAPFGYKNWYIAPYKTESDVVYR